MDSENTSSWVVEPSENFLPEHNFYLAVQKFLWKHWEDKNIVEPHIFMTKSCKNGLSHEWSKYCSPIDTKLKRSNYSEDTGVIQYNLGHFFQINEKNQFNLTLEHAPILKPTQMYQFTNRGHSLVHGIDRNKNFKSKIERKMTRISKWVESCRPEIRE